MFLGRKEGFQVRSTSRGLDEKQGEGGVGTPKIRRRPVSSGSTRNEYKAEDSKSRLEQLDIQGVHSKSENHYRNLETKTFQPRQATEYCSELSNASPASASAFTFPPSSLVSRSNLESVPGQTYPDLKRQRSKSLTDLINAEGSYLGAFKSSTVRSAKTVTAAIHTRRPATATAISSPLRVSFSDINRLGNNLEEEELASFSDTSTSGDLKPDTQWRRKRFGLSISIPLGRNDIPLTTLDFTPKSVTRPCGKTLQRRMIPPISSKSERRSPPSLSPESLTGDRRDTSSGKKLHARSPVTSPQLDWTRRHLPSKSNEDEDIEDSLKGRHVKDEVPLAQIIKELDRYHVEPPMRREESKESFNDPQIQYYVREGHRRQSGDSSISSSRSFNFFGMVSSLAKIARPQELPSQSTTPVHPGLETYTSQIPLQLPRLESRDDRTRRMSRLRSESAASTTSSFLERGHEIRKASLPTGSTSMADDDDDDEGSMRRDSSSSSGKLYGSIDDPHASDSTSSMNRSRSSLAVPPKFARSLSCVPSLTSSAANLDQTSQTAMHLRDLRQAVSLWIPEEQAASFAPKKSGNALSKVLSASIPMRRKLAKRESTQLLSSLLGSGRDETKIKDKEKGKASEGTTLPAVGHWISCEIILRSSGDLLLSTEDIHLFSVPISLLKRTDIRQIDQSLLGKQRCIAIHAQNHLPTGFSDPSLPSHPSTLTSTIDFSSSLTSRSVSQDNSSTRRFSHTTQAPVSSHTIYLTFPNWVTLHTWISALQIHARPEIYPSLEPQAVEPEAKQKDGLSSQYEVTDSPIMAASADLPSSYSHHPENNIQGQKPEKRRVRLCRSISLQIIEARNLQHSRDVPIPAVPPLANIAVKPPASASHSLRQSRRSASLAYHTLSPAESEAEDTGLRSAAGTSQYSQSLPPKKEAIHTQGVREKAEKKIKCIHCDVWLGYDVVAKTSVQPLSSTTVWQEAFDFSNLGTFDQTLEVRIYVDHEDNASSLYGNVQISLQTIKQNQPVEEWFPILPFEANETDENGSLGRMSLNIQVREIIVSESEEYTALEEVLSADKDSSLIYSLLSRSGEISVKDVVSPLLRVNIAKGWALSRLVAMAEREIILDAPSESTLFRGNTLLSKSIELYMRIIGADWLESSIGDVIRRICQERIEVEIDPSKIPGAERDKNIQDQHVAALQVWTSQVWDAIYISRHRCPSDLRRLFRKLQDTVERHFTTMAASNGRSSITEVEKSKLRFTSINAFVFLRFFVPAVLNPRLFALCPAYPQNPKTQRTLTLIAKTLQNLANVAALGGKEPWMATMNPFLQSNITSFQDFVTFLCSPPVTAEPEWTSADYRSYSATSAARELLSPKIVQEGVPTLPFLIDVPKELAIFASTVAGVSTMGNADTGMHEVRKHDRLQDLVDLCTRLHTQTHARYCSLEKTGGGSISRYDGRNEVAAESMEIKRSKSSMRARDSTHSHSVSSIKSVSMTPHIQDRNVFHFSPLTGYSQDMLSVNMKRRSNTVSGSPLSNLSSKQALDGPPKRPEAASELEVLDIHLPRSEKSASYARLSIVDARPILRPTMSDPAPAAIRNNSTTIREFGLQSTSNKFNVPVLESNDGMRTPRAVPAHASSRPIMDMHQQLPSHSLRSSVGIEHEVAATDTLNELIAKQQKSFRGWSFRKHR